MTQKHNMTAPKMTRVTVRVPKMTLDQINDWVDTLGVRRSHFLGIALVAGVRSLMQASALEMPLAPENILPQGAGPAAEKPAQQPVMDTVSTDQDAFAQVVTTLRSEIASLQSEVTDLRKQLQTQRGSGKRHS